MQRYRFQSSQSQQEGVFETLRSDNGDANENVAEK